MQISFSTASFNHLDFQTAAELAKRCGYDGVELPATHDAATPSLSNALLTAPLKIRRIFGDANVQIPAIHIGTDLSELPARIALAAELGAHFIKLKADSLFGRTDTVLPATIDLLLSAGDIAAAAGKMLLIENQPLNGSALRLWHLLDRLNHPSIGCCWNTFSAAIAGDLPAATVPLINSRIRFVVLQDAKQTSNSLAPCDLGDGDLPLQKTTDRLRGIGFNGWLRIGFSNGLISATGQSDTQLSSARAVLQKWQLVPMSVAR